MEKLNRALKNMSQMSFFSFSRKPKILAYFLIDSTQIWAVKGLNKWLNFPNWRFLPFLAIYAKIQTLNSAKIQKYAKIPKRRQKFMKDGKMVQYLGEHD